MSVRWPDGSVTGSVRVEDPAPTSSEPEPEETKPAEPVKSSEKKEASGGDR